MIDYTLEKETTLIDGLNRLKGITELLRSEEGCPWDKKQTAKDFAKFLIEETYEFIDAIDNKDTDNQSEELGDVMNNLLMLTTIQEQTGLDVVKTVNDECSKIVRRHPHVFSKESTANNSEEVIEIWNKVKVEVEGRKVDTENAFTRIPKSLAEIAKAFDSQKIASKLGFDWVYKQDVIDKICEELDELIEADTALDRTQDEVEEELGDLLFAVINYSRFLKVDPTLALRKSTNKFQKRFNELKKICEDRKIIINPNNAKELDKVWEEVKSNQKK